MKKTTFFTALVVLAAFAGCKQKKVHDDIIVSKVQETVSAPSKPVAMQSSQLTNSVQWLGKQYDIEIQRSPSDSLPIVKDEQGRQFVDNRISLVIRREDKSVAISKHFFKTTFQSHLDGKYRNEGILEGLVFDKVEGQQLVFAASVCLPGTDEYIPLNVKVDNFGNLTISRDTEMDTHGDDYGDDV